MTPRTGPDRRRTSAARLLAVALGSTLLVGCRSQRAVERVPGVDDPLLAAAQATRTGEWARAAHYWRQVFELRDGRDTEACMQAARAMRELGDAESASNMLQLGLREDPNNPDLLELKGDALVELGFRRSAEMCYERCLEQDPNRISALCALGRLRLSLDREAAACKPLQRALDLGCDDLAVLERLALAYRDSGEPVRAWNLFARRVALEPPPTPEFVMQATELALDPLLLVERPDATAVCLVWLECSLQLHPEHTVSHFQRGRLHEALGNRLEAADSYLAALRTDSKYLPAITHLALLFAELEREEHCREMVERALALESDRHRRAALSALLERFE